LFSTVLKKEEDSYYLVTPVEKIKIDVEIAPYMITDFHYDKNTKEIVLDTNFDYSFPLNQEHPLTIKTVNKDDFPIVNVRSELEGLVTRNVFYKLIDIAISQNNNSSTEKLVLESFNSFHELGSLA
jgi:hypothetical protein